MTSIVQELRTSKRQFAEKTDATRRRHSDVAAADNNNNDDCNYNNAPLLSSSHTASGSAGGGCHWNQTAAVVPTAAAQRRTAGGQSRSRKRRSAAAGGLFYDEYGALDLTSSVKKSARTSNSAATGRPSVLLAATTMGIGSDDSAPLDLSVRCRLPYALASFNPFIHNVHHFP